MTDAAIVGSLSARTRWAHWPGGLAVLAAFGVIGGFMQGFSILVAPALGGGDMRLDATKVSTLVILAGIVAGFHRRGADFTVPPLRADGHAGKRKFDLAAAYLHSEPSWRHLRHRRLQPSFPLRALGTVRR